MSTLTPTTPRVGVLSQFPVEIRRMIYGFTLDQDKKTYEFQVEGKAVLHVSQTTFSNPRPTPAIAHVCKEMRDYFLESHKEISFTCATYLRSFDQASVPTWHEEMNGYLTTTGWFNNKLDQITFSRYRFRTREDVMIPVPNSPNIERPYQREVLFLCSSGYPRTDFSDLVETQSRAFARTDPLTSLHLVVPVFFQEIIVQDFTITVRFPPMHRRDQFYDS